jgi:hypothetical protein
VLAHAVKIAPSLGFKENYMMDSSVERTVILTAIALWFAHGWHLNERLKSVHAKLDSVLDQFNGLREYLYEIDPQFDDERESSDRFEKHMSAPESNDIFAGMNDMELISEKEKVGRRTLNTPFVSMP